MKKNYDDDDDAVGWVASVTLLMRKKDLETTGEPLLPIMAEKVGTAEVCYSDTLGNGQKVSL